MNGGLLLTAPRRFSPPPRACHRPRPCSAPLYPARGGSATPCPPITPCPSGAGRGPPPPPSLGVGGDYAHSPRGGGDCGPPSPLVSVGTPLRRGTVLPAGGVLDLPLLSNGGGEGSRHPSLPPSQHSALPCPWVRLEERQGGCPEGLRSTRPPPLSAAPVGRAARSARSAPATPCNIGSSGGCNGSAVVTTPLLFPWGLGGRAVIWAMEGRGGAPPLPATYRSCPPGRRTGQASRGGLAHKPMGEGGGVQCSPCS